MIPIKRLTLLLILVLSLTGCNKKQEWPDSFLIGDLYNRILENADQIEISSGMGDGTLVIDDPQQVLTICEHIAEITCTKDDSQEDRTGWQYLYHIYSTEAQQELIFVVGGSTFKDNFRADNIKSDESPYYIIENEEALIEYTDSLF